MQTFQEYERAVANNRELEFIRNAIEKHKGSDEYKNAKLGDDYMRQQNTTITQYRKWLYDINGGKIPDDYSANYKCASAYYKQNVIQLVQYLLSNGVTFEKDDTKDKLGGDMFDNRLTRIVRYATAEGRAYGYYDGDEVVFFRELEFVPLFDEETGALRMGIRYWSLEENEQPVLRITVYKEEGYTDYIKRKDKELEVLNEQRKYNTSLTYVPDYDDDAIVEEQNYSTLPIVPCYSNYEKQAEIVGKQAHIDCYDLIESGYANDIDQATFIYWVLHNAGGMDNVDIAEFMQRLRTLHVVKTDDQSSATAQTMNIPSEARETLLNRIEQDIYNDAMALNPKDIAAGNITATAIKAAYQRLDNRTDELEYCVIEFVQGLLKIIGVEDMPKFKRNRLINMEEETSMVLSCASVLDQRTLLEHLPILQPEEIDIVMDRLAEQQMSMLEQQEEEPDDDTEAEDGVVL